MTASFISDRSYFTHNVNQTLRKLFKLFFLKSWTIFFVIIRMTGRNLIDRYTFANGSLNTALVSTERCGVQYS